MRLQRKLEGLDIGGQVECGTSVIHRAESIVKLLLDSSLKITQAVSGENKTYTKCDVSFLPKFGVGSTKSLPLKIPVARFVWTPASTT